MTLTHVHDISIQFNKLMLWPTHSALKCTRKPRSWRAAALTDIRVFGKIRRESLFRWLKSGHFILLPLFMGKNELIHSQPPQCPTAPYRKEVYHRRCCSDRLKINERTSGSTAWWKTLTHLLSQGHPYKTYCGFCNKRSSGFIEINLFWEYPF